MKAFILCVSFLNVAWSYTYGNYGNYGGYGTYPGSYYPGYGTYGTGTYGTGYGGTYSGYPGVVGKRDAPTQGAVDVSLLYDAIQAMLQQAKDPKGIPATQIKSSSLVMKSMAHALLKENKDEIIDDDVNKLIVEIAANISGLSVVDILNAGPLDDEAYRVTVIFRMLRECAERIKILHATGKSYAHAVKAVYRLAVKLIRITDFVVDLIKVQISHTDGNKRGLVRRQGPWQFDGGMTWDEETGFRGAFNTGYKDGTFDASSRGFYDEESGRFGLMGTFNWG